MKKNGGSTTAEFKDEQYVPRYAVVVLFGTQPGLSPIWRVRHTRFSMCRERSRMSNLGTGINPPPLFYFFMVSKYEYWPVIIIGSHNTYL